MQAQVALRLARQHALRRSLQVRALASTTANAAHVASAGASSSSVTSSASRSASVIPLSNVEAQWATLSAEEKATVHDQLEVLQKKQWKELSLDEKRAGTCLKDNLCTNMRNVDVVLCWERKRQPTMLLLVLTVPAPLLQTPVTP